jgi:hypothetical protein
MTTTENIIREEPKTTTESAAEIAKENPNAQVFVLYRNGVGSQIVGIGQTYEEMWQHGASIERASRDQMLKAGYVFDVIPVKQAEALIG